ILAAMNQYVYVSLSLIGLCGIVGAGVAVGSGVGMMAMQMQDAEDKKAAKTVAHSPVELKALKKEGIATSFAASAQN
ncbi:hypothetical protein H632_c2256p0, partial [Helicosporidium sp. ATCC 50920]